MSDTDSMVEDQSVDSTVNDTTSQSATSSSDSGTSQLPSTSDQAAPLAGESTMSAGNGKRGFQTKDNTANPENSPLTSGPSGRTQTQRVTGNDVAGVPDDQAAQEQRPPDLSLEEVKKMLGFNTMDDVKKLAGMNQRYGHVANELGQTRRQLQELEKFRQESLQKAQASKLKPWSSRHPEHGKWQNLSQRVERNQARVAELQQMVPEGLSPEQSKQWLDHHTQRIRGELTNEDITQWNDFIDHKKQDDMRWHTDREGMLDEIMERKFEEKMAQWEAQKTAYSDVQRDLDDPIVKEFLGNPEQQEQFESALDGMKQDPWTFATHMVKLYQDNQRLRSLTDQTQQQAIQAQDQARVTRLRSDAAHTRDPKPPKIDPYAAAFAEAKKDGIDTMPDNPVWRRLLKKHQEAQQI